MCLGVLSQQGFSQRFEATWKSLDSRPTPSWFSDAKFGIFIHWGPYSVPAWSPKGTYSEWYQYWLETKNLFGNGDFEGDEVYQYHVDKYGPHFSYYQFGDLFKAELFDAKEWAELFADAGARYIVITSKHHDGYTLWPNIEANDRGFPWNSSEVGSGRDLLGELTGAIHQTDLKMGMYYSLYEWFHPWWLNDRDRFVEDHMFPQFKDLVTRYEPDIVWADGEWEMEYEQSKTPELLAWLFNDSPVADRVAINDRWGKGARHEHGGYFTTEYDSGLESEHPWEECRGMGFSFGYNRNEDAWDYNSPQTLILLLTDVVSRGGNLLLDIGPRADGQIPAIMQERLLQMGRWLKINGEAIYGTRPWKKAVQWSEGNRDCKPEEQHYLSADFILKQTLHPDPGCARKELFFTTKGNDLYVIAPRWPGKEMVIKDLTLRPDSKVVQLGHDADIPWKNKSGNVVLSIPMLDIAHLQPEELYAFTFKIMGAAD